MSENRTRDYYEERVAESIANPGEKVYVELVTEEDAANFVGAILLKPYDFTLRTLKGVECVNARSMFGVIYFLSQRNNSYLVCEGPKGSLNR